MELGRPLGAVRAASGRYQQSEREGGRNDQPDEDEKGNDKALGHGNPLPLSSIGRLERAEGSCAVTEKDQAHDPEKWGPVFGKDHAHVKSSALLAGRVAEGVTGGALLLRELVGGQLLGLVLVGLRFLLFLRHAHLTLRHDDLLSG
jgi:hypothetical protein